jgi:hypothetical protein
MAKRQRNNSSDQRAKAPVHDSQNGECFAGRCSSAPNSSEIAEGKKKWRAISKKVTFRKKGKKILKAI